MRFATRTGLAATCSAVFIAAAAGAVGTGLLGVGSRASGSATPKATGCSGPVGAAYVAESSFQQLGAIDTANCTVVQSYNIDDPAVLGNSDNSDYVGSDPGIALSDGNLWFAVAGTSSVAVVATSSLDPKNYNPPYTLIPVGLMPGALAVSPDGTQVWVADTGPQTGPNPSSGMTVIDAQSEKVVASWKLAGDPTAVAFAPSGQWAYVTTTMGLVVYNVATRHVAWTVSGLDDPESVAVSPDGRELYVTETAANRLATLSATTGRVLRTTAVDQLPWQMAVGGGNVYVACPDSDAVDVVNAATGKVENRLHAVGGPTAIGLTPDGSQLWVASDIQDLVTVFDTATGATVGSFSIGGFGPQSGDGFGAAQMVLTTTPTPGS